MTTAYDRATLVATLVYHWQTNTSGCGGCNRMRLGDSYPEHVADLYEEAMSSQHEETP